MWTEVNFGKWRDKGKTLPQVLVADPDWFFWALEEGAFKGAQAAQAQKLARRARAIKLPSALGSTRCVQHWIAHDGKYARFDLIEQNQGPHHGSSTEVRRSSLNMEFPRGIKQYDKLGCKELMKSFKYHWFEGKAFTKAKVEAFFDDVSNFENP
ncbi:hypothetical protein GOB43_13950 [Sinorhizobium meliloti]|uniref:hypothetical protein n=1 Tax=Rhizobium meliloti TaxID=382 RepID=UPI000FD88BA2|nr:hypothetical protein [Sinorhizobium meliloti]MDW9409064.1 hypothetical protein [Sinorhizobium meliloti]MDW9454220.1 hypothetical protein [Sinorhizobium meliloti]MDW9466901.1 hypothetical protein [Sinorhizobium meliloti]MDW9518387.1 hypothetical protein [Sinorhizobium meliloti]MDW9555974.1 hypothetical protein [Sinorhizobium meliloti]